MVWLSAVDATTGATYFFDDVTQQTSWTMPVEKEAPNPKETTHSPRGRGSDGQLLDVSSLRLHGSYSVIKVDNKGTTQPVELRRRDLLAETGLPGRDLRRIDPSLVLSTSAPTLRVGDRVILLTLGHVRCGEEAELRGALLL